MNNGRRPEKTNRILILHGIKPWVGQAQAETDWEASYVGKSPVPVWDMHQRHSVH